MRCRISIAGLLLCGGWSVGPALAVDAPTAVDFARDVAPLFQQHCIRCHSPAISKGDVSVTTAEGLADYLVAGDAEDSYLIELVTAEGGERPAMPQEGEPLSEEHVSVLRRWIDGGAQWPEGLVIRERSKADSLWWSLQPLASVEPPAPADLPETWQANPVDRFVFAALAERQLRPNPPAERAELIRRATYDLTGLPPAPEEVADFVADPDPDAYERLLDRLLDSPHYGQRWGRHWLDVVRFGESRGFERNEIIDNLWPFRDYVIRSFNEDKPLDRLIREHLAGDVLGSGDPQVEVGVAFLVSGPYDDVGNQDVAQAAQIRANTIDEIIGATSEAFLGLTVACARCHDHKFDPIEQRDYYAWYATFAGVRHGQRPVGSEEIRRAAAAELGTLEARRKELAQQREALQQAILTRAQGRLDEHAAGWTRPPVSRRGTEERFAPVLVRYVKLVVEGQENSPEARSGYHLDEFEVWTDGENPRNVALAAGGATAHGASRKPDDFAAAYSADLTIDGGFGARWIAAGPELTITLPQAESIERVFFSSDRTGAAGDHSVATFVSEYRVLVSPDGDSWAEVADSRDRQPVNEAHRRKRLLDGETTPAERQRLEDLGRQVAGLQQQIAAVPPPNVWWVGTTEASPGPFHVFLGGDPRRLGEEVTPGSLKALSHATPAYRLDSADESRRRLALADWIVHPENPLTPRVLANRLWHYHFGTGIVDTPSDFGYMGGKPTHPQLLDWLAGQLHAHGWRLKPLHKLIMTSEAYRQSSQYREQAAAADADARYLWRFPPRRLSAEEIRDTLLAVAGQLDPAMGGPGFQLYRYMQDNVATYVPLDQHGPETYRRAVYHQNARAARIDLLSDFDGPDCAFAVPRRTATTTPLQALTMLNHRFTLDMAEQLAERVRREGGGQDEPSVRRAFVLCFAREPSDGEAKACLELVRQHGLAALCRVLLNTSELIYVK